jgi:epidermal growth factor receptor kinase substrate 8
MNVPPPGSPVIRDFSTRSEISIDSIERNGGAAGMMSIERAPSAGGLDPSTEAWIEELQARDAKIVQVTYPRTANNDKELSVVRGEFLEVLDDTRKWWKARNMRGRVAHVPHTIVTTHAFTDGGAGREDMYGGPQTSSGYSKGRVSLDNRCVVRCSNFECFQDDAGSQQNVMPAEWVRNKHLGKKGEFRYF